MSELMFSNDFFTKNPATGKARQRYGVFTEKPFTVDDLKVFITENSEEIDFKTETLLVEITRVSDDYKDREIVGYMTFSGKAMQIAEFNKHRDLVDIHTVNNENVKTKGTVV